MHTNPADQRRRLVRRRTQVRRRRVVALVVFVTLISFAIWVAYAIPGQTPARVPAGAAQPSVGRSIQPDEAAVVAEIEGTEVLLPVAREVTTAVAFHPVDNPGAVGFSPVGERVGGGGLGQRLADIFARGGGLQYYLMDGGGQDSPSTAGLDIGAVPGSPVLSPVDGKVTGIKQYSVLGRYRDYEIDITLAADPSLLLIVTHIAKPRLDIGDVVQRGKTVLGAVRGFPPDLDQALSQFTLDNGDHVQLTVVRITPELAGL
ncbi:MAG: M23 family metallopeptidase [Actinobacteria bacterium]|nr:M23 family metallopeptidase [Actinomycetota bacterium]